jgi:hypothetical protein
VDEGRAGRTDPPLLVGLQTLADVERQLGSASIHGDGTAVGPDEPMLGFEGDEVLADGDRRDAEPGCQVGDSRATVFLDDPDDVLLSFASEDVA